MANPYVPQIDATVPSPCVDICRLDPRGFCVGCRRTMDEIAEWPRAGDARRRAILGELARRTITHRSTASQNGA